MTFTCTLKSSPVKHITKDFKALTTMEAGVGAPAVVALSKLDQDIVKNNEDNESSRKRTSMMIADDEHNKGDERASSLSKSGTDEKQEEAEASPGELSAASQALRAKKRKIGGGVSSVSVGSNNSAPVCVPVVGGAMNWWKFGSLQKDLIKDIAPKNPALTKCLRTSSAPNTNNGKVNAAASRVVSDDNLSLPTGQQQRTTDQRLGAAEEFQSIVQALQQQAKGGVNCGNAEPTMQLPSQFGASQRNAKASLRNASFPPVDGIDQNQNSSKYAFQCFLPTPTNLP